MRIVDSESDLVRVQALREQAYGHHLPGLAAQFGKPDPVDRWPDVTIFYAEDKLTGQMVGSARVQVNRSAPLQVERCVELPVPLQGQQLAEVTRMSVIAGYPHPVKIALVKAVQLYCMAMQVNGAVAAARPRHSGNPDRRMAFGRWKALRAIIRPPPPPDDHEAVVRHLVGLFSVIGRPAYLHEMYLARPYFERAARRGLYRQGTMRQMLAILATGDRRSLLREIHAPTMVLHGADDPLVPLAAGIDTAANIPGSRLEVVPGMGHDFPPSLMATLAARIAQHCRAAQPAVTA